MIKLAGAVPFLGTFGAAPLPERVAASLRLEEQEGLRLAAKVRSVLLAVAFVWLGHDLLHVGWAAVFNLAAVGAVLASGLAEFAILKRHRHPRGIAMAFALLDSVILGLVLALPNPWLDGTIPVTMTLKGGLVLWFVFLLALRAFALDPLLLLWSGVCAVLGWSIPLAVAFLDPSIRIGVPSMSGSLAANAVEAFRDLAFVHIGQWYTEALVLLLVAAALAAAVERSRRLALTRAGAERRQANLARYFSPRVVERLARSDQPFGGDRRQEVAVLFADIKGFTTLSERLAPEEVMQLLREFHARMEEIVFAHGGTLDKFIGDALLVTFGVPDPAADDAVRALACARAMLAEVGRWNDERARSGQDAIGIGIGLHYGPVVMGDVGSERSMAFTVVGDTVNTASRLQGITRELGCGVAASEAFMTKARGAAGDLSVVEAFRFVGPRILRGRSAPIEIWCG
ncbi:adenylate/guanylate cyclase domain-containing protein [Microvirga subterranea]|uniref:Adenylate cyclase n=1 Tax=Microvirga subterranea TaxID=186651 RepID=A0A370HHV4_9HYPH|nr:adenylate/guanylate cyclase domain-containing protein [Microvirga subterranea]RDI57212.1 adenylate cyclase [Microvirga subterranea]